MIGATLFAIRAFLTGIAVGVRVAPGAGAETRRLILADLALLTEALPELLGLRRAPPPIPERIEGEPDRAARV